MTFDPTIARTIIIIIPTYTANLNGDELRVASLAALALPIIKLIEDMHADSATVVLKV